MLMRSDEVTNSLELARREFARVGGLVLHEGMAFWHAVRTLPITHQEHDEAIEVLVPVMEKNPNWAVLMHRLPDLPDDSPLRVRFSV